MIIQLMVLIDDIKYFIHIWYCPYMISTIYICYHLYIWYMNIYDLYSYIYIHIYSYIYIYYIGFPSHLSWHRRVTAGSATLLSSLRSVAATCSNVTSVGSCNSSARRQVWWEKCGKNMGSLPWEIGISNGISWDYDGIRLRWINTCKVVLSWNRSHRVDDG